MPRRRKRKLKIGNLIILITCLIVVCVGGFSLIHILTNKKDKEVTRKDPSSISTNEPVETEEPKENKISLFLTGDGLLHDSVYTDAENEDGTFTMVVVLQVIHPGTNEPSEFGNDPLEVVVDMRSGHPVFLSAKIKEL